MSLFLPMNLKLKILAKVNCSLVGSQKAIDHMEVGITLD